MDGKEKVMGKGIRSTAEHGSVSQLVPIRRLFVAGLVLAWAAGAAAAQEAPPAQKPAEPKQQQAVAESVTASSGEAAKAQEQAKRDLQWRQEMNESMTALRRELREMQEQRAKEAAEGQEVEKNLRMIEERVRKVGRQVRAAREELGKHQSQFEEVQRQQETLQAKVHGVEQQLAAVRERAEAEAKTCSQQRDSLRQDLQRMGRTIGQVEQGRLKAEGEIKADVQELRGELGQVRGTLRKLLTQNDRSTVGSAGYTWGW
jgi:chromosome segregation ATPase